MLKHVPETEKVQVNELEVTSGFGGTFPKGLVIGQVTEVGSTYDARFQRIVVKPAIVAEDLDTVLVLVKKEPGP